MQLFSVDQQRSQALEAHAASFASIRVGVHFSVYKSFTYAVSMNKFCIIRFCMPVIRFLGMIRIPFLFLLLRRAQMLVRLHLSCMLLSLVLSQVDMSFFCYCFLYLS